MCTFLVLPRQRIGTSRASVLDDLGARLPSPRHAMAQERQLRYEGCNPTKIIAEFETQTTWYLRTSEKPIGRVAGQPRSAPLARKARRARLCTTSHMSSRCYEAVRSKLRRSAGSAGLFPVSSQAVTAIALGEQSEPDEGTRVRSDQIKRRSWTDKTRPDGGKSNGNQMKIR